MTYRGYQLAASKRVFDSLDRVDRTLVVLPTGTGKTVTLRRMIEQGRENGYPRCVVMVHKVDLVNQIADRMADIPGTTVAVEQAGSSELSRGDWNVAVCSIQTLQSRPEVLQSLVGAEDVFYAIDEAHRAITDGYIDAFRQLSTDGSTPKIVGMTATDFRGDEQPLSLFFEDVAMKKDLRWAWNEGWLVRPDAQCIRVEYADGSETAVEGEAEDLIEKFLDTYKQEIAPIDQPVIVMAPSVSDGFTIAERLRSEGVAAHMIDSKMRRVAPDDPIYADAVDEKLNQFREQEFDVLVNYSIVCLDEETEILTSNGWTSVDDMTLDHEVANWDDGSVFFEKPLRVVDRDRTKEEQMVSVKGLRRSIRVTEDHELLHQLQHHETFSKSPARDLVNKPVYIPVSGIADPLDIRPEQPKPLSEKEYTTKVRSNSYNLRKREGYGMKESKVEARRRIDRRYGLRRKDPFELTIPECQMIGFWVGDGSTSTPNQEAVEYYLQQSTRYPFIVDKIDEMLDCIDIDTNRTVQPPSESSFGGNHNTVRWGFPRGTGFGSQERDGIFPYEPYLDKEGSRLWWGLDEKQFDAFLYGLWLADGLHGDASGKPDTLTITLSDRHLLSHIQAIASVRGYSASIGSPQSNSDSELHALSLRKQTRVQLVTDRLQVEEEHKEERVWCVTTQSGNIITRRHGKVAVMGNCEGFDAPPAAVLCILRNMGSPVSYMQSLGRILRPYMNEEMFARYNDPERMAEERREIIANSMKPSAYVFDFVDVTKRHDIMTMGSLFGLNPLFDFDGEDVLDVVEDVEEVAEMYPISPDSLENPDEVALVVEDAELWSEATKPNMGVPENAQLTYAKLGNTWRMTFPDPDDDDVQWLVRITQDARGEWIATYEQPYIYKQRYYNPRRKRYGWKAYRSQTEPDMSKTMNVKGSEKPMYKQVSGQPPEVIGTAPHKGQCFYLAESWVYEHFEKAYQFAHKDAAWRYDDISSGQAKMLKRMRKKGIALPGAEDINKGNASLLIDLYFAGKLVPIKKKRRRKRISKRKAYA